MAQPPGPAIERTAGAAPPEPPVTHRQLAAALAAGIVGAVAIPDEPIGLGVALTGAVLAAAVLTTRPADSWDEPWRRAAVACALAATPLPALSDAGWAIAAVLLAGVGMAVLAFGGGVTWLGLVRPALRCLPVGLRSTGALASGLRRAVPGGQRFGPAVRATVLTVVLLAVFGSLFASADEVFGSLVDRFLLPDIDLGLLPVRLIVLAVVAVAVTTFVRLRPAASDDRPLPPPTRHLAGVEWQVPLAGLVALFAAFVTVQFGVLFGGHERVLETAGLTYAEHARGGFAQLIVVAMLTLVVIAAAARYAPARGVVEARLRRGLLAALCGLTLVVLASALHRMDLYEEAFGATRARFGGRAIIWWLAGVFVLVLIAGARQRVRSLPRVVALLTGIAVVATGYLQPDAMIARWNVERYEAEQAIDVDYLAGLSADAVPALLELPADVRGCVLPRHASKLAEVERDAGWGGWNLSRARAADALAEDAGTLDCAAGSTVPRP